jgi:signal transduction histidine kinase
MAEMSVSRRSMLAGGIAAIAAQALPGTGLAQPGLGRAQPREFNLAIEHVTLNITGRPRPAIAINRQVPGPVLKFREGEEVLINVANRLREETSIHWHGLILPSGQDGVPGISDGFQGIAAGQTHQYRFPLVQSGTYWYHSHSGTQEQAGFYGPLTIAPVRPDPFGYDRDYIIQISDWTDENPHRVIQNLKRDPGYYTYNKRTAASLAAELARAPNAAAREAVIRDRMMWGQMRMDPTDISSGEWPTAAARTRALSGLASEVHVRPGRYDAASDRIVGFGAVARLADGSWLNVEIASFNTLSADQSVLHSYAAAIGLALLLAVGFAARSVSAPVSALARTVSRFDPEQDLPPLPASGPREVRQLAEASNDMAARTRDAFRQRTLALGALSHDLMSPIARLKLRAEDLPHEDREPIRRDLAEMETMVSDVLAYLRGGHAGEAVQPVAVTAHVRTVVDEFADVGTPVEEGRMDEDAVAPPRRVAIKRAVTNVVANALRHGRAPWVEVGCTSEAVLVRVADHGPGIPPEDLPRVMEPFFRGDRARTAGGGSGLGLSTARAIVEAHGGSLTIESAPGRGTSATNRLLRTR